MQALHEHAPIFVSLSNLFKSNSISDSESKVYNEHWSPNACSAQLLDFCPYDIYKKADIL